MPLLSEYLNLSLVKPSFSPKSNYLTMSCSDVIRTETVDIGYLQKDFFAEGNRKYFCWNSGIIYRPSNQSNFLEIIKANFDKLDTDTKESYIFGDFNINMYQNNKYIVTIDIKNYQQFCTMHGLKQLIKSPTV